MKIYILLLAVSIATAAPGQFYQHHQYQRTASAYKNDELQHQVEDAGYYTKHGNNYLNYKNFNFSQNIEIRSEFLKFIQKNDIK